VTLRGAPRLRFGRSQRLLTAAEFACALAARPAEVSTHFQLFRPHNGGGPRLGIIVGKRFIARAVDRSKVKRVIRECFRTRRVELAAADYVVRVRTPVRVIHPASLRAELELLLKLAPKQLPGADR
jgi:ribonuclease P protein component